MDGIASVVAVLSIIFVLACFAIRMEQYDKNKIKKAFESVKDDPKSVRYLAFLESRPVWRISLIGSIVLGSLFYLYQKAISKSCNLSSIPIFSASYVAITAYLILTSVFNYQKYHGICPDSCSDIS